MPSCNRTFLEGARMRTRIFLLCAVLGVAFIATGADESYDKLYSAIRANDLRQM